MTLSNGDAAFLGAMIEASATVAALLFIVYEIQWNYFERKSARKKLLTARRTRKSLVTLVFVALFLLFPLANASAVFMEHTVDVPVVIGVGFVGLMAAALVLLAREIGTSVNYVYAFMLVEESAFDREIKLILAERIEESTKEEIDEIVQAVKGGDAAALHALQKRLVLDVPARENRAIFDALKEHGDETARSLGRE